MAGLEQAEDRAGELDRVGVAAGVAEAVAEVAQGVAELRVAGADREPVDRAGAGSTVAGSAA